MHKMQAPLCNLGDSFAFRKSGEMLVEAGNVGRGNDETSQNCNIFVIRMADAQSFKQKACGIEDLLV